MIKGRAIYSENSAFDLGYYNTLGGAKRVVGKYLSNSRALYVELWDGNDLIAYKYKDAKWVMQPIKGKDYGKDISER